MDDNQIALRLERALEGARKVTTSTRGWSTVSKQQIECMAVILTLLFDEKSEEGGSLNPIEK